MKIKISILAAVIGCGLLIGCTTPSGGGTTPPSTNTAGGINITNTARAVEIAVETATGYAVRKDPETRKYFVAALATLDMLLNDAIFDPQQVREAIAQVTGTDPSAETWLAITTGLNLYRIYAGNVVDQRLDQIQYLRPVLLALQRGIRQGLPPIQPLANQ